MRLKSVWPLNSTHFLDKMIPEVLGPRRPDLDVQGIWFQTHKFPSNTQCLQIRHSPTNWQARGTYLAHPTDELPWYNTDTKHLFCPRPSSGPQSRSTSSSLPICHPLTLRSLAGRRVTRYLAEPGTGSDALVGLAGSTSDIATAEASHTKSVAEQVAMLEGRLPGS
jgi:hypothetical protein